MAVTGCLVAALFCPPARAEESFRGDETRERAFDYDRDHFTDLLTFRVGGEWEERWERVHNGYLATVGSLTSREFYIRQEVKLRSELGSLGRFGLKLDENEDFDSRHRTLFLEWSRQVAANGGRLGLFGSIHPDKEYDDLGLAAGWEGPDDQWMRLSWLFTDFTYNSKAPRGEDYERKPATLRFQGSLRPVPGLSVSLDVGRQTPLTLTSDLDDLVFTFDRTFARCRGALDLPDSGTLYLSIEGERAQKGWEELDGSAPRSLARRAASGSLELVRRVGERGRLAGGLSFIHLMEEEEAGEERGNLEIDEQAVFVARRFPLGDEWFLEPLLVGALTRHRDTRPGVEEAGGERTLESKLALGLGWERGPTVSLLLNPTFDLDAGSFGGGNVRLFLVF